MNEFYSDHIRINLTSLAQKVIDNDCIIFGASSNCNLTYGAFINKIIKNFDDDFTLNENLLGLYGEKESRIIRLQNDVIDILDTIDIKGYLKSTYNPSISKYIKCLLESFVRLPFIEREKLLLKTTIQSIETAIKSHKNLHITFKGSLKVVTPIAIVPAKEGTFQYLVGEENSVCVSIRLSRIEKIRLVGKSNPIPKNIISQINSDLSEFGPTFIAEPKVTIKVKFTQKGAESYKYSVIHRPIHTDVEPDNVYIFCCSETQALYFFFRFAGDVEILEPQSLRNKMRDLYRYGLEKYL
ncbi:MAG: WYL domain-containing protein [Roseburia sp.]|nr:WYL domain-containing protein [Roseburia sp.]